MRGCVGARAHAWQSIKYVCKYYYTCGSILQQQPQLVLTILLFSFYVIISVINNVAANVVLAVISAAVISAAVFNYAYSHCKLQFIPFFRFCRSYSGMGTTENTLAK